MTKEQVAWAKQHDWFISSRYDSKTDSYIVTVQDDFMAGWEIEFCNFNDLKTWAGY